MNTQTLLNDIEAARVEDGEEPSAVEKLILKHAMRSFGSRGYAATSLRRIAADAQVTAPLVSYYFKSKENLFVRVAEIVMASLEEEVAKALEPDRPFHESVEAIVQAHAGLVERCPAAVEFMFSMLYGPQEGQPVPDIDALYAGTARRMLDVFERGVARGEIILRRGMTPEFLVEQLGNLIHAYASCRLKAERRARRETEGSECRLDAYSLDVALQHFFFGAGDVPALTQKPTTGARNQHGEN